MPYNFNQKSHDTSCRKCLHFNHLFCYYCSRQSQFIYRKNDPSLIYTIFFQSFFGFGQSAEIDIILDGAATRRTAEVKTEDGKKERLFLFFDGESLSGKVMLDNIYYIL